MLKIDLEQGTAEWHEFRKKHIGSSDSPIIMGESRWCTPYRLWRQKNDLDPSPEENSAMKWGKKKEEEARQELSRRLEIELIPIVGVSKEIFWASASLDGLSIDGKTLVEIKNPTTKRAPIIPKEYMPQLQKQMFVTELDKMIYFDYTSDFVLEVERDEAFIKKMLAAEEEFWDCLKNLRPPKSPENNFVVREDTAFSEASLVWKALDSQIKELEKKEKEARDYLLNLAGDQNVRNLHISIQKVVRKGNIDYTRIPELQNIDLEKYRKGPIETWRIT